MRYLLTDQIRDLAAIYDDDVELVSVARANSDALAEIADRLFPSHPPLKLRWTQAAGDSDAPVSALPPAIDAGWRHELAAELAFASEVLGDLLACEHIGVRLETLRGPMCPRFHTDRVPCRMLMTIRGTGTEWIPNDDIDRELFADRRTESLPVRRGAKIRRLHQGHWSLLKGGTWSDAFDGVVHRSPHQVGERLLVSLDPLFSDADA